MATVEQIKQLLQDTKDEIVDSITLKLDKKFDEFKKEMEEKVSEQATTINKMKEDYDLKLLKSVKQTEEAKQLVVDLQEEFNTFKEDVRKKDLITEYHNKMKNIIVGGFPDKNEWEKQRTRVIILISYYLTF